MAVRAKPDRSDPPDEPKRLAAAPSAVKVVTRASRPVLASWRISQVLERYPELLDVLVALSPAFAKLRNPILRRIKSRLVSVGQAAKIAGLEPSELVMRLNAAIGLVEPAGDAPSAADELSDGEPPAWVGEVPVAVELDVRPLQGLGEEPFGAIMAALARVPVGQTLRLRSSFEPVPLYDVLAKRGFAAWAHQLGPEDWEVSFLNTGAASQRRRVERSTFDESDGRPDWGAPSVSVTIDVGDLVPPEPMIRILEALEVLPPGGTLLVHHVRRPMHLYPRLDELGCRHDTRELGPNRVELLIQKPAAEWEVSA